MGSVSNSGGTSSSVSEVTSTVRDSHLFVSHVRQRETDSSVGGSSVFDLERSNREGSGSFSISRFLLPSFLQPVGDESSSFGLVSFRTTLHLKSVVLATDYTTVVAYLKNQGGTHCFSLYSLCREILLLCWELQIQLVVRHIPGHLNVLADILSRSLAPVNTEWELLQVMFNASVFFGVVLIWICLLRH